MCKAAVFKVNMVNGYTGASLDVVQHIVWCSLIHRSQRVVMMQD